MADIAKTCTKCHSMNIKFTGNDEERFFWYCLDCNNGWKERAPGYGKMTPNWTLKYEFLYDWIKEQAKLKL
jgi:hypothetical protein